MKNIILFKIAGLMLLSCQNNVIADKDYKLALNYFDSQMTDHFPKNGSYKSLSIETDTSSYYNTFGVIVTMKVSQESFSSFAEKYRKFSLVDNANKNIAVVDSFLTRTNYPDSTTIFCGPECLNQRILDSPAYILPNFYFNNYADSTTLTRLPNSFKHIIIEQKKGIFSNKIREDISTMPINYFHGYSKGISFNDSEKVIIYWTIIW